MCVLSDSLSCSILSCSVMFRCVLEICWIYDPGQSSKQYLLVFLFKAVDLRDMSLNLFLELTRIRNWCLAHIMTQGDKAPQHSRAISHWTVIVRWCSDGKQTMRKKMRVPTLRDMPSKETRTLKRYISYPICISYIHCTFVRTSKYFHK